MASKYFIVAIAGPSGSGKTEITKTICEELNHQSERALVLHEDAYYRDQSHLSLSEREKTNYDHPGAFDHQLLIDHIHQLKQGKTIDMPVYDYDLHNRGDHHIHVTPKPVMIIEGILLLANEGLLPQFDLKIYMDTPMDVCLARRIERDILERGRDLNSVLNQYQTTVRPMCEQHILPSRTNADLIVPHGGKNRAAIELIKAQLSSSNEQ